MLEPDVRLFREGWLEAWAAHIAGAPSAWVIGSGVRGNKQKEKRYTRAEVVLFSPVL